MKTGNYVIKRDDVLVGGLSASKGNIEIFDEGLYELFDIKQEELLRRLNSDDIMLQRVGGKSQIDRVDQTVRAFLPQPWLIQNLGTPQLFPKSWPDMRTILFILNDKNFAEDLLFDSPNYPVLNLSDNESCLMTDFTISHNIYKIGPVLKYLGFPANITLEDVMKIKETCFSIDWVLNNSSLFGVHETGKDETGYQTLGIDGTNRSFNLHLDDGPIPEHFFYAFWCNKQAYIGPEDEPFDIFDPSKKEGKIKRLIM